MAQAFRNDNEDVSYLVALRVVSVSSRPLRGGHDQLPVSGIRGQVVSGGFHIYEYAVIRQVAPIGSTRTGPIGERLIHRRRVC